MAATSDDFPHHGEHLVNDEKQAEVTIGLIAAFVIVMSILAFIVVAIRAA
ncbi:MAG TPA: hypothetical protein VLB44_06235 [Kofleriaceae bacterium]|jgi:hypothetical protein|nr:hypothetical protein [Kofleriaceae bacterium]